MTDFYFHTGTRPNAARRGASQPAPALAFGNDAASFAFTAEELPAEELPAAKRDGRATRIDAPEAAVLQTFPADFPFQGNKGEVFQQIGNAFPPLLALAVLREVTA